MKKLFASKWYLFFETIGLVIVPLLFLSVQPGFFKFRILTMLVGLVYVIAVIIIQKLTFPQMGFIQKWTKGFLPVLPLLLIAAVLLLTFSYFYPSLFWIKSVNEESKLFPHLFFVPLYVLLSVPLQEFIFRGFYIRRLELVSKNKPFLIFYSALVFMLIHVPFGHSFMLWSTFFLGVYLAHNFLKYRNIYVLFFVHAVLGTLFVYQSLG